MEKKISRSYFRKEIYSIEEVLSKRDKDSDGTDLYKKKRTSLKVNFDGDLMKMGSLRYFTFAEKGVKCVSCGIEGKYFAKERSINDVSYHFNLYAINEQGEEILMTKDHIHPRSLGGRDHIDNMQTMCTICNQEKGNKIE